MISRIKSYFAAVFVILWASTFQFNQDERFGKIFDILGEVVLSIFLVLAVPYVALREKV